MVGEQDGHVSMMTIMMMMMISDRQKRIERGTLMWKDGSNDAWRGSKAQRRSASMY